jgi:AbrB family looped-hinge helix DNA binding protein
MPTATLTSKGQITLPKPIRDRLRLAAGDRVDFVVQDDGTVVLRPVTVDVRELRGLLHRKGRKPLSVEAMNAVIRRRAAGRT